MNIPAMCTGEMKYVILRIDTHVLRIDLCPRNRTRIRRQKQDEDVHLFLSERKKARPQLRQGPSLTPRRSWPRTRQTWQASLTASAEAGKLGRVPGKLRRRLRTPAKLAGYPKGPECTTRVGAYCIRPTNRAARPEWDVPSPPVFDRIGYPARPGFRPGL